MILTQALSPTYEEWCGPLKQATVDFNTDKQQERKRDINSMRRES